VKKRQGHAQYTERERGTVYEEESGVRSVYRETQTERGTVYEEEAGACPGSVGVDVWVGRGKERVCVVGPA
jgi:hypothetical protein